MGAERSRLLPVDRDRDAKGCRNRFFHFRKLVNSHHFLVGPRVVPESMSEIPNASNEAILTATAVAVPEANLGQVISGRWLGKKVSPRVIDCGDDAQTRGEEQQP